MSFNLDLKESNEFLNMLFHSITSVVFVVDNEQKIKRFNNSFVELFKKDENEVLNVHCGNVLGCAYAVEANNAICGATVNCRTCGIRKALARAYAEGEPTTQELLGRKFYIEGEKQTKYFLFSTKPIQYQGEKMMLLIVDDVTELERQKQVIMEEKRKSEKLLLNVLPAKVADELKLTGTAKPELFENITVLFSDMVNFTKLSAALKPQHLIEELNDIFTAFDNIMDEYKCERIKTIGDAYLAVSGMPMPNANHARNIAQAGKEMIEYLSSRNGSSAVQWKTRIGIHSGKAVGGVVGVKKYIYDVFGDTINTASRVETNSKPMQIAVSETTYQLLKNDYQFVPRPPLQVKGKGLMKMYFLQ